MGLRLPAPAGWKPLLGLLLAAGFLLRLVPVVIHPSLNWGDEVYQSTEQAHRLVYGTGLVPWEFQVGMRSWLLPGAIAAVMEAARAIGPGPAVYLPAIAAALGLLSLAPILCAFLWCRRVLGVAPALLAALVAATAPELVYFGDRALTEVVAAHVFVLGLYVLLPGVPVQSRWRPAVGGALLGLTLVLRLQMLPAVALAAVLAVAPAAVPAVALAAVPAGRKLRAVPAAAGFVGAILAGGLLDAVTLGAPFASVWRYIDYNVVRHASTAFGVQPWWYYGAAEIAVWGGAILMPVALCIAGRRVGVMPGLLALVIIVAHCLLGHKEQRFIYPALVLLAVQAGFGLAWAAAWATSRLRPASPARLAVAPALGLAWCAVALTVWQGPGLLVLRARVHDQLAAASFVANAPDVCGIGMYGPGPDAWVPYGGYTYLHRNVTLFWPADEAAFTEDTPAFNTLLTEATPPSAAYTRQACFGTVCVYRRPGPCAPRTPERMPFPKGITPTPN